MLGMDFELLFRGDKVAPLVHHAGARDDPFRTGPAIAVDLNLAFNRGAMLTRALGHRLRHVGGVNVAVLRVIERADQIIGAHQRPAILDFLGRQELVVDASRLRDRGIQHVFVHAFLTLRHPQVADHRESCVQAGLGLEPLVEIHRVFVDMGGRKAHVEQGQQTCGVPGRAGSQLVAFHQHRIPTRFGKVIGDAVTDGTTADDQGFDMGFHEARLHR
jgi:hypothetical protein